MWTRSRAWAGSLLGLLGTACWARVYSFFTNALHTLVRARVQQRQHMLPQSRVRYLPPHLPGTEGGEPGFVWCVCVCGGGGILMLDSMGLIMFCQGCHCCRWSVSTGLAPPGGR